MEIFDSVKNTVDPQDSEEETEVIIESDSLLCDVQAFVEKSPGNYYFYLWFNPLGLNKDMGEPRIKMCWVCNRRKAPSQLIFSDTGHAKAPLMPAEFVAHDLNGIDLDESRLSIVWFQEGASAALLCGDEILCVIPEWSGYKDFHGYSKYARGTGPYAWEMTGALQNLTERVRFARALRDTFTSDETFAWRWLIKQRPNIMNFVGTHEKDYDIGFETDKKLGNTPFPPKAVISGSRDGVVYGVTVGVSLPAMPNVDYHVDGDPKDTRRMELGFAAIEQHRALCHPMYGNLGLYATMPWQEISFLAHGHTVEFNNIRNYAAVVFINPRYVEGLETPDYSNFLDGGIVNMLWIVPISQAEFDFLRENNIDELIKKAARPDRIHIFDGTHKFIQ